MSHPARRFRPDSVDLLTLYFATAFFIPGNRVLGALGSAGRPSFLIGFALFGLWAGSRLTGFARRPTAVVQPLRVLVWLWGLAVLMSLFVAYSRGMTGLEFTSSTRSAFTIVGVLGVLLVALDTIPSMDRIHVLLRRMSIIGLFSAALGIIHYVTGSDVSLKLNLPGLTSLSSISTRDRFGVARVFGTSYHAIEFGIVHSILAGVSAHVALHARSKLERRLMWMAAALHGGVATLSSSRTQVVALTCVVIPLFLAWRGGWRVRAIAAGVGAIVTLNMIVPGQIAGLVELFSQVGADDSSADREADYPVVFRAWRQFPIFGRGTGTWGPEGPLDPRPGRLLDNGWLVELITTGVFGVLTLLALLFGAVIMARRIYKWGATDEQRHLGALLSGMIVAFAATNFLFDGFYYSQYLGLKFVSIGIVGAVWRLSSDAELVTRPAESPVAAEVLRVRRTTRRSPARPTLAPARGLGVHRWSLEIPADAHAEFWERRARERARRERLYRGEVGPIHARTAPIAPIAPIAPSSPSAPPGSAGRHEELVGG